MSPASLKALEPRLKAEPAITYMAVNAKGDLITNLRPADVNAVTWGVFPAKEVIQPTVVDPQSFMVWKVSISTINRKHVQLRQHIGKLEQSYMGGIADGSVQFLLSALLISSMPPEKLPLGPCLGSVLSQITLFLPPLSNHDFCLVLQC